VKTPWTKRRHRVFFAWCLALLAAGSALQGEEPIKNSDCLDCHADNTLTKTNALGREISLFVDAGLFSNSVHRASLCVNCHPDITS